MRGMRLGCMGASSSLGDYAAPPELVLTSSVSRYSHENPIEMSIKQQTEVDRKSVV